MATGSKTLPDDVATLQKMLLAERAKSTSLITRLEKKIEEMLETIRLERHRRFGSKSEKHPGQGELFDEAENQIAEQENLTEPEMPVSGALGTVLRSIARWSIKDLA